MVNNYPTLRAEPEEKGGYCKINPRLACIIYVYTTQPDWSLLFLVNIQGSLYCKQGSLQDAPFYNFLWYMKQNVQLSVSVS